MGVGGLAISVASMSATIVSSGSHSVNHAKAALRGSHSVNHAKVALKRKEHQATHAASTEKTLTPLLELALLLLLCVLIPCWYLCHHRKSPKVTEEAPLLSDDL